MLRIEAIKLFLHNQPYHMAQLYTSDMEVQVNVAKDNGDPIHGSYAGVRWHGYTDGLQTWKSFRIPWKAATDPKYEDSPIKFNIAEHAEAIGMTGWDWINKRSRWVGFDFDSIVSHKEGLTQNEILSIKNTLESLSFISMYSSTSGLGLHVYVYIQSNVQVNTHTDHAAVARAILSKISSLTGLQLEAKVDTLGGNMWVWHRKVVSDESYVVIKEGEPLTEIPANWQDYLENIRHRGISPSASARPCRADKDDLIASKNKLQLDPDHLKLIQWLENSTALAWYDDQKQMLVCHTADLKRAHIDLGFKGFFDTISTGKDHGHDQNCFCFPCSAGAWIIRRHTRRCKEHESWFRDNSGWTSSYYNRLPSLRTASKLVGGVEGEKVYNFKLLKDAVRALLAMEIDCEVPPGCDHRTSELKQLLDGRIKISFQYSELDVLEGWAHNKKVWERYFFRSKVIDEIELPDHIIRHIIVKNTEYGWFVFTNNEWVQEPRSNLTSVLMSLGYKRNEVDNLLGQCVLNNWELVSKPFQPEYPGNREWNKGAPQLRFNPVEGEHPYWDTIFNHIGSGLEEALIQDEWAKDNGIVTGILYLQAWCASFIQDSNEPLPYLFLYGSQNTGKSIFHEALSCLFTSGYCRSDQALNNPTGFNGELANAILCIVEETNLSKRGHANDRIKDWVTGRTISIRALYKTPYDIPNTTHWVQCANEIDYCPIFPGDTRITSIQVSSLDRDIPKPLLLEHLEQEAMAFTHTLLNFELPERQGRLRIPVIETEGKIEQMAYNKSALERFIEEEVHQVDGYSMRFSEFYAKFQQWLEPLERQDWTNRKVSKQLSFPKGKMGGNGQIFIGNISFTEAPQGTALKKVGGRLV